MRIRIIIYCLVVNAVVFTYAMQRKMLEWQMASDVSTGYGLELSRLKVERESFERRINRPINRGGALYQQIPIVTWENVEQQIEIGNPPENRIFYGMQFKPIKRPQMVTNWVWARVIE